MKQIPNNNKATMNNKVTAKQTKKQRKAEAILKQSTNTILLHWNMNFSSRWKIETLNDIHHPE